MNNQDNNKFDVADQHFQYLLEQTIADLDGDIDEADKHVGDVAKAIAENTEGGLAAYGTMYQEALKVKGSARDRYLKLLRMVQERLRVKEANKSDQGNNAGQNMTPERVQEILASAKDHQSANKQTSSQLKDHDGDDDDDDNQDE